MYEVPTYVPLAPFGVRPAGADRLGIGRVSVQPETARALNAPEESSAKSAFSEREAAIASSLAQEQSSASFQSAGQSARTDASPSMAELGARARIAAGGSGTLSAVGLADTTKDEDDARLAEKSNAMRQRVELAVRLALPSEESSRRLDIVL